MTKAEAIAREIIKNTNTEDLLTQWELTTVSNDPGVYTVRGWLMDEFEARNPEAFDKWIEEDAKDETLREYMVSGF
jgi:hypothetical protein